MSHVALVIAWYCSYITRTDPADVARVESKTWICTENKYKTVPHVAQGVPGILGKWCNPEDAKKQMENFNGCMAGKWLKYTLYFSVIFHYNYSILSMDK